MLEARGALLESMVNERAEVEAWLAAEWSPQRRWVITGDDYREDSLDDVVTRMVHQTASDWGAPFLGFVDDMTWQRREQWRVEHRLEDEPRQLTAWIVPDDSETAGAWREHLAPLLRAALSQALATFPIAYAGREIKNALTQQGGYDAEQAGGGFEELWEGSGETGLSKDAGEDYLELRYYPDPTWMCNAGDWPESIGARLWERYRVLPAEIMAILDAVRAAERAS